MPCSTRTSKPARTATRRTPRRTPTRRSNSCGSTTGAGPGIPHGKSDALVYLFDLFPTICDLAGAEVPKAVEGKSVLPIVLGKQSKVRDHLLGAYKGRQRMVRDDRFKLIKYNARGVKNTQLFDLAVDPDEVNNLAADPKYADQLARLEKLLAQARKQFGDPVDFDGKGELPEKPKPAKTTWESP